MIWQVQRFQRRHEVRDVKKMLRKISAENGNIAFESTAMRNGSYQWQKHKRVSFVSHLLLLSLLISFTTSASTVLAVASLFSKPLLNIGGSTRWESVAMNLSAWLRKS